MGRSRKEMGKAIVKSLFVGAGMDEKRKTPRSLFTLYMTSMCIMCHFFILELSLMNYFST